MLGLSYISGFSPNSLPTLSFHRYMFPCCTVIAHLSLLFLKRCSFVREWNRSTFISEEATPIKMQEKLICLLDTQKRGAERVSWYIRMNIFLNLRSRCRTEKCLTQYLLWAANDTTPSSIVHAKTCSRTESIKCGTSPTGLRWCSTDPVRDLG